MLCVWGEVKHVPGPLHTWMITVLRQLSRVEKNIKSMYGIFTYIYHQNEPNVEVNIPIPWIFWEPKSLWMTPARCSLPRARQVGKLGSLRVHGFFLNGFFTRKCSERWEWITLLPSGFLGPPHQENPLFRFRNYAQLPTSCGFVDIKWFSSWSFLGDGFPFWSNVFQMSLKHQLDWFLIVL